MKVNVKGLLLEKFVRKVKNKEGVEVEKMYLRIYQTGERLNLDVNVNADTYAQVKTGQTIQLDDININAFNNSLYAMQSTQ